MLIARDARPYYMLEYYIPPSLSVTTVSCHMRSGIIKAFIAGSKHWQWESELPPCAKGAKLTGSKLLEEINTYSPKAPRGGNLWQCHKRVSKEDHSLMYIWCACRGVRPPKKSSGKQRNTRTQRSDCKAGFVIMETRSRAGHPIALVRAQNRMLRHTGHPNMSDINAGSQGEHHPPVQLTASDRAILLPRLKVLGFKASRMTARPIVAEYLLQTYGSRSYILDDALDYLVRTAKESGETEVLRQVLTERGFAMKGLSDSSRLLLHLDNLCRTSEG